MEAAAAAVRQQTVWVGGNHSVRTFFYGIAVKLLEAQESPTRQLLS